MSLTVPPLDPRRTRSRSNSAGSATSATSDAQGRPERARRSSITVDDVESAPGHAGANSTKRSLRSGDVKSRSDSSDSQSSSGNDSDEDGDESESDSEFEMEGVEKEKNHWKGLDGERGPRGREGFVQVCRRRWQASY